MKKRFTCLGKNTKKYITLTVPIEDYKRSFQKKLQELIKVKKKLQKIYLTYYNLLIIDYHGKLIMKSCP